MARHPHRPGNRVARRITGARCLARTQPRLIGSLPLRASTYCTGPCARYTNKRLRPLRVYLLILVLGAILPGALLTGVLVWRAFANTRELSERRLVESARVDASAVDRQFADVINTLEVLATSPALDRGDLEAFYQEGQRVRSTQPDWYNVLLLSVDGRQLVSTRLAWGTPLLPVVEPESLRRVIETWRPVVGSVRRVPDNDPDHRFAVRVPVLRESALKYVLTAVVNVRSLTRVVPQLTNSEEWTRSILDPEGTIAVRTRGSEDYVGEQVPEAFRARLRDDTGDCLESDRRARAYLFMPPPVAGRMDGQRWSLCRVRCSTRRLMRRWLVC